MDFDDPERPAFEKWASRYTNFPEKYDGIPASFAWKGRAELAAALPDCEHVVLRRVRDCAVCEACGSVLTDGSWGTASGKWFRSYADAMRERHL